MFQALKLASDIPLQQEPGDTEGMRGQNHRSRLARLSRGSRGQGRDNQGLRARDEDSTNTQG